MKVLVRESESFKVMNTPPAFTVYSARSASAWSKARLSEGTDDGTQGRHSQHNKTDNRSNREQLKRICETVPTTNTLTHHCV